MDAPVRVRRSVRLWADRRLARREHRTVEQGEPDGPGAAERQVRVHVLRLRALLMPGHRQARRQAKSAA